jgi:hypothetical protein
MRDWMDVRSKIQSVDWDWEARDPGGLDEGINSTRITLTT